MKKAKLKIDYFTCSSDATIKDIFKKGDILTYDKKLKMYYRKETNSLSTYPEIFIEKNTDIFEIFEEPEPQEEVIEGYACYQDELDVYYFTNENGRMVKDHSATLILNPKKREEGYIDDDIYNIVKENLYINSMGIRNHKITICDD